MTFGNGPFKHMTPEQIREHNRKTMESLEKQGPYVPRGYFREDFNEREKLRLERERGKKTL